MPWYPINAGKLLKPDAPDAQKLARIAAQHSATVAQLSLAWLLQRFAGDAADSGHIEGCAS